MPPTKPPANEDASTQQERAASGQGTRPVPALLVTFSDGRPVCQPYPVPSGQSKTIGRSGDCDVSFFRDQLLSRKHVEVRRVDDAWEVRDLGSRNKTFVDGREVDTARVRGECHVLRVGGLVILLLADCRKFADRLVHVAPDGHVLGPAMSALLEIIVRAARDNQALLVMGETGTGKEYAAQEYHRRGPRAGRPFVAVDARTITPNLADALLFGARRGAHSEATRDTVGYFRAAHGGVLFIDEIANIPTGVGQRLLRALEAREVVPLGDVKPIAVDIGLVCATNVDLHGAVRAGRFPHDLLERIAQEHVHIPPLRERREEIPYLVKHALGDAGVASARFVELCMLRSWERRNIRGLISEVRRARTRAEARGAGVLDAEDLPAEAETAESSPAMPASAIDAKLEKTLQTWTALGGDRHATRTRLGINASTLTRRLQRLRALGRLK